MEGNLGRDADERLRLGRAGGGATGKVEHVREGRSILADFYERLVDRRLAHRQSGQETPAFRQGEEWPPPFFFSPLRGAVFGWNGETPWFPR